MQVDCTAADRKAIVTRGQCANVSVVNETGEFDRHYCYGRSKRNNLGNMRCAASRWTNEMLTNIVESR
jgi:hypothetical protein